MSTKHDVRLNLDSSITLRNGYPVVSAFIRGGRPFNLEPAELGCVIAHLADNDYHPYVVWNVCRHEGQSTLDAFHGEYCTSFEAAVDEMQKRVKRDLGLVTRRGVELVEDPELD